MTRDTFDLRLTGGVAVEVSCGVEARASAGESDPVSSPARRTLAALRWGGGLRPQLTIPIDSDTWPTIADVLDDIGGIGLDDLPPASKLAARRALERCAAQGWTVGGAK